MKKSIRSHLRADFDHFLRLSHRQEGLALFWMLLNPRTLPVVLIRISGAIEAGRAAPLGAFLRLLILWIFRVEVPKRLRLGPGFVLPHPGGIVLGAAEIGSNVIVYQNVTIGAREFDCTFGPRTRPVIEDGVVIGAGAVVLGPINVGNGSIVAANSLVLKNLPAGATALGVPAKVRLKR